MALARLGELLLLLKQVPPEALLQQQSYSRGAVVYEIQQTSTSWRHDTLQLEESRQ